MNPSEVFWTIGIITVTVLGRGALRKDDDRRNYVVEALVDVGWGLLAFAVLGACGVFSRQTTGLVNTFDPATVWAALLTIFVIRKLGRIESALGELTQARIALERLADELAPLPPPKPVVDEKPTLARRAGEVVGNAMANIVAPKASIGSDEPRKTEELSAAALVGIPIKKKKPTAPPAPTTKVDDSNWPKL